MASLQAGVPVIFVVRLVEFESAIRRSRRANAPVQARDVDDLEEDDLEFRDLVLTVVFMRAAIALPK